MKTGSKFNTAYWIKSAIGILIMVVFALLPSGDIITPLGMDILGIFIGTIFLWSAVGSIWPSILALVLIGLSGYAGESAGVSAVFMAAYGNDTVLTVIFSLILFGGISALGFAKYISNAFLRIKAMEGRPYVFFASMMLCSYVVSGLTITLTSMLLLFPVVTEIMERLGYKKGDKAWYTLILGVFLAAAVGQPMLPFKGAALIMTGTFSKMFNVSVSYAPLTLFGIVMALLICALYLLLIKFVIRPDLSKLKNLKIADLSSEKLPPLTVAHKIYIVLLALYIIALLLPSFIPAASAVTKTLKMLGSLGAIMVAIFALEFIDIKGKPVLSVQNAAQKFSWDIFFMVPAGVYIAGCLTNADLGITPFLRTTLSPIFADKPMIVFVGMIVLLALLMTQCGGNVPIAIFLFPIVGAFAADYASMSITVVCVLITYVVTVALCLPAGSPYCAVLHSRKDLVSFKEIQKVYLPMMVLTTLAYTFVGYWLASILF